MREIADNIISFAFRMVAIVGAVWLVTFIALDVAARVNGDRWHCVGRDAASQCCTKWVKQP